MSTPKGGLGKGLGALMQRTDPTEKKSSENKTIRQNDNDDNKVVSEKTFIPMPDGVTLAELPLAAIIPNAKQPRTIFDEDLLTELVESIKEVGILQPIVVRQVGEKYELIMGERRWRASQLAGLATVPAIIRNTADNDMLRDALLENLHRAQLNPLEEAAAYQQMLEDFGCTQEELSQRVKRSRPQISNTIRLLRLPGSVQRQVSLGAISAGHARALLALGDDPENIGLLAQRVVTEGLSVRATEELVAAAQKKDKLLRKRNPKSPNPRAVELSESLSDRFDTKVRVNIGKKKGQIVIEFAEEDDLERILAVLNSKQTYF
ncbi:MAG: ParB/RepB/Spo0J family partition protein [Propionibacteriaceae bacterium]